ncbi:MAG: MGMT family protein [Candidatus Daviesbacteria bacterium]|nr:MGMT family protein [Candidatus Daviesbacteria bacterium]
MLARGQSSSRRNFKYKVIQIVKKISNGRVTTYGTVATLAGLPRGGRLVGGILHFNSDKYNLPWQRIINKDGFISTKCPEHMKALQKALLEQEGIEVSSDFMIDLDKYGWWGK